MIDKSYGSIINKAVPAQWTSPSPIFSGINGAGAATISVGGDMKFTKPSSKIMAESGDSIQIEYLVKSIKEINKRLRIIVPDEELMNKYPSLRDAYSRYIVDSEKEPVYNSQDFIESYDHYCLIESLLTQEK